MNNQTKQKKAINMANPNNQLQLVPYRPQKQRQKQAGPKPPKRQDNQRKAKRQPDQVGAVVRSRITRTGVSDIRHLRVSWVAGYTYVGNGTAGATNGVYFLCGGNSSRFAIQGNTTNSSGQVPILSSDLDVGAPYVSDIEKHFSRKCIHRMWVHVDSLQPSTSNNMMAVIGFSRGSNGLTFSIPRTAAGFTNAANSVQNVMSMKGAFTIDSWEHQTVDITEFIAGGSGAKQCEFDIGSNLSAASVYASSGNSTTVDGDMLVPACFAVAGNNTTTGLQGTNVHQITFEQEVSYLDYLGGMAQSDPA